MLSRRVCVGLLVQLLSERSGGGCALKPAFLNRCWVRLGALSSALFTYKMNIFGKIFNCRSDVAGRCLNLKLAQRFFSTSSASSRAAADLDLETFAAGELRILRPQQPAIKNVLHARKYTLTKPHTHRPPLRLYYLFFALNVLRTSLQFRDFLCNFFSTSLNFSNSTQHSVKIHKSKRIKTTVTEILPRYIAIHNPLLVLLFLLAQLQERHDTKKKETP